MFLERHPCHQEAPRRSVYKVCRGCSGDISHLTSVLESIHDGERTLTRYPGFLQLLRGSFAGAENKEPSKELTPKPVKKVEKAKSSAKEECAPEPRSSIPRDCKYVCLRRLGEYQQQKDCSVCEEPVEKEAQVKKIGRDLQFYQQLKVILHKNKSSSQVKASGEACPTCQKHVATLKAKEMEGSSAEVEPPAKKRRTTV